jgi:hypothetical protein
MSSSYPAEIEQMLACWRKERDEGTLIFPDDRRLHLVLAELHKCGMLTTPSRSRRFELFADYEGYIGGVWVRTRRESPPTVFLAFPPVPRGLDYDAFLVVAFTSTPIQWFAMRDQADAVKIVDALRVLLDSA